MRKRLRKLAHTIVVLYVGVIIVLFGSIDGDCGSGVGDHLFQFINVFDSIYMLYLFVDHIFPI